MGLILDLAVVALAVAVIGSLALLTWTLGVTAVRAVAEARAAVASTRRTAEHAERGLQSAAGRVSSAVERLTDRTSQH